jgi:hypothetical protein
MSQVVAVLEGEKNLEYISEVIAPSISPAWVPDGQYIYIYCFMFSIIISTLFMFPLTLAEAVFLHLCIRKDYLKISSF